MKTIKPGNLTPKWVGKRVTCHKCRAVFELEKGDEVTILPGNQVDPDDTAEVTCPECGTKCDLAIPHRRR